MHLLTLQLRFEYAAGQWAVRIAHAPVMRKTTRTLCYDLYIVCAAGVAAANTIPSYMIIYTISKLAINIHIDDYDFKNVPHDS
jgi:hypothetical protein